MLQAMAFGGNLGDSLFANVGLERSSVRCASHLHLGHLSISVSAATIWLHRLRSIPVVLRLRGSCWLL